MRILMFGTVYCDTEEKLRLARQWMQLHGRLNPGCDLVLVDSASPLRVRGDLHARVMQLGDNIGHLTKCDRDGWGRAFCAGLQYAVDKDYDYAVHVEGDSLLRLPVTPFCEFMREQELRSFVCGVNGTKFREFAWVETGVMLLSVPYVRDSNFIERYDWPDGKSKKYPHTPEAVIYEMLTRDDALSVAPIRVMRDDRHVLTVDNVGEYDWISHTTPEIYSTFVTSGMVPA